MNGSEVVATIGDQDWRVTWHPPPSPPPGTPHGAEAICVAGDRIVLVSRDGHQVDLPAGRPDEHEDWADTLRREVRAEPPRVGWSGERHQWSDGSSPRATRAR